MALGNSGLALTLGATALVGYCIYFDYKRRTATDYKQKIREKRRVKQGKSGVSAAQPGRRIPSPTDPAAMQQFFTEELELGEALLGQGEVEKGLEHLSNAIALCGSSGGQQLLQLLQQTMPAPYFRALLEQLPTAQGRLEALFSAAEAAVDKSMDQAIQTLVEDELE